MFHLEETKSTVPVSLLYHQNMFNGMIFGLIPLKEKIIVILAEYELKSGM